MTDEEDHFHHSPKTVAPAPDDGPPDGYEADWFKWRSRVNRRHRFRPQASATREHESPSNQGAEDCRPTQAKVA